MRWMQNEIIWIDSNNMASQQYVLDKISSIFDPSSMFTGEKRRGVLTSVVSGLTASGLHAFAVGNLGMSVEAATFLILNLFGGVLGYVTDILFAKANFRLPGTSTMVAVPYSDLSARTRWLVRSFMRKQFLRYWVVGLIDAMVGIAVIKAILAYMDRREILVNFRYRAALVATAVTVVNFLLFVNILRFDWAYRDGADDPIFNAIVLMWMTLTVMLYALYVTLPSTTDFATTSVWSWTSRAAPASSAADDGSWSS